MALFEPMFPRDLLFLTGLFRAKHFSCAQYQRCDQHRSIWVCPALLQDDVVQRIRLMAQLRHQAPIEEINPPKVGQKVRLKLGLTALHSGAEEPKRLSRVANQASACFRVWGVKSGQSSSQKNNSA